MQQLCLQILSFWHGANKALVRLSICNQLRPMRHQGERQALHMQQPLPGHEHAPPDVALRHTQGPPQRLHLLAPVPELLPIQLAIQPAITKSYCHLVIRTCDTVMFTLQERAATKAQILYEFFKYCRSLSQRQVKLWHLYRRHKGKC